MRGPCCDNSMTFGAVALVLSTIGGATPAYIWNASKSVPIGLYQLQPVGSAWPSPSSWPSDRPSRLRPFSI